MNATEDIFLFRITHINNLGHILQNGLWTAKSEHSNPNYSPIGDKTIIDSRKDMPVINPPGGYLSDYIPFYFGARSPMLYTIKNGYNGVTKTPQEEIIYIVVPFKNVRDQGLTWFFTDGNARNFTSKHFRREEDFKYLDWAAIRSQDWKNTEEDWDRKRRKQAEFLIKEHLPASCISHLIVYNEKAMETVKFLIPKSNQEIKLSISRKHYF